MLKHRILTATLLIPLVLWAILTLSTGWLAVIIGTVILIGAWEWAGLCGWQGKLARLSYTVLMGLSILVTYLLLQPVDKHPIGGYYLFGLLASACLWWLIAGYWVWSYQRGYDRLPVQPWIKGIIGFLILLPTCGALFLLSAPMEVRVILIFLLVLIWTADTAAYFSGKRWGRHKLADKVSPGKTWEGVVGGLLSSLIIVTGYTLWADFSIGRTFEVIGVSLITVTASILGDLLESVFKRQMGLKDSGQLLPGHGGMLDRIDSLTAAAPVLVAGVYFVPLIITGTS
jgi:phosphatidate cytidylyltransferase